MILETTFSLCGRIRANAHLIEPEETVVIGIHVLKQLLDLASFVHSGERFRYRVSD